MDAAGNIVAYVTAQQLALYWAVNQASVQRWLRSGDLPGKRFRGCWRVETQDALQFEAGLFAPRSRSA